MSNQVFCKDCKWLGIILHKQESLCHHEQAIVDNTPDLVTGQPRSRSRCYEMRRYASLCGPEGKLFEPAD